MLSGFPAKESRFFSQVHKHWPLTTSSDKPLWSTSQHRCASVALPCIAGKSISTNTTFRVVFSVSVVDSPAAVGRFAAFAVVVAAVVASAVVASAVVVSVVVVSVVAAVFAAVESG